MEVLNVRFCKEKYVSSYSISIPDWRWKSDLNVTQDILINQISTKEGIDIETVRKILKSTENIVFHYLSSIAPSEEVNIKLFNGINIRRRYIEKKKYSKGMFQNIDCPEHVNVKACLSKYYNGQVNNNLFCK